ncbi:NIPSNAP family protein [Arenibacter sp. GZD96]|uniref:NIPSNAP family protein n=1 Tax=Aurantibrevibacter litoralis TaxID=3106030 RepID=UPI002AFF884A|nr:NIPSNAP family protein [Arenibacter sp. GZD-96]MEA1786337.1 NIPSNAP family protein [Arenibacter sp. GZD-96]
MKYIMQYPFFILISIFLNVQAQQRSYFQLKIYTLSSDTQISITDAYLKDAYLPALKRTGISNIGVFKPKTIATDSIKKIYVLTPYASLEEFQTTAEIILKDELHNAAGAAYLNAAYNQPPYVRIESVLLYAFEQMPGLRPSPLTGPRTDRIYELRSYESPTEALYRNKVHMFNEGGEVALFEQLGFNAVFYGEVLSGAHMPNLVYMTTFENQESRDAHWKAFGESAVWSQLKVDPYYQNNMSKNDARMLYPTEYSDY